MTDNVVVTLIENSSADNPDRVLSGQTVEVRHVPNTVVQGVDGHTSIARHASEILWRGGLAQDLERITDVKIADLAGAVLVDGELNRTFGGPRDTSAGVKFSVL